MEEADPIDPGTLNSMELAAMGIIDGDNADAYSWAAPRNMIERVRAERPGAIETPEQERYVLGIAGLRM